jgi:hypothetical protein
MGAGLKRPIPLLAFSTTWIKRFPKSPEGRNEEQRKSGVLEKQGHPLKRPAMGLRYRIFKP